jgi:hypothetical protein
MNRIAMSPAAAALLRLLIGRARVPRDRILLMDVESVDWRSLTFTGERHQMSLRVTGRDGEAVIERMCAGLEEAEFSVPGIVVADIAVVEQPERARDGSFELTIEALTVAED